MSLKRMIIRKRRSYSKGKQVKWNRWKISSSKRLKKLNQTTKYSTIWLKTFATNMGMVWRQASKSRKSKAITMYQLYKEPLKKWPKISEKTTNNYLNKTHKRSWKSIQTNKSHQNVFYSLSKLRSKKSKQYLNKF